MTEFLNLQVYGVPIATYGLVGLTTAILAYATSISEVEGTTTESPISVDNMNPFSAPNEERLEETSAETTGGKRRRNRTPKRKRKNKNNKTKHNK